MRKLAMLGRIEPGAPSHSIPALTPAGCNGSIIIGDGQRSRMEDEMALSWKGTVVAMIAGGAIGVFLAPLVRPAIARNARPALKAA
jgi:hypothetical protein